MSILWGKVVSIEGKVIVFTGKISKPRHEFQALVEEHGGIAGSDVSSKTDYLVVGEKPGSKLMRATVLGIRIISERDFVKLLQDNNEEKVNGEVPLTSVESTELEKHIVTPTCSNCNRTYRQWDTLPNYETCPVCEILSNPLCPHCKNNPIFVTDFNLYVCMLCGTWFKAPYSIHARHTEHLHFWYKTTSISKGMVKECPCGTTLTILNDGSIKKYEPAYIRERHRKDVQRYTAEQNKIWGERWRKQEEKEQEALAFVKSLSEEQISHLEDKINANV